MGSKGSQTTTTQTTPNPQAMTAYSGLLDRANQVANQSYVPYTGELVSPVNQQQYLGIGNINANANYAQPLINTAAGMAYNAAQPITQQQIQQYMNPFTQNVVNQTQAQFNNQNQQQLQNVRGNAIAQGALGGNREAVAEAETTNQQQLAQAPVIAGLESQGYQTGLNTALTEQQALASGAYGLGNLGVAGQQAALSGAGAQIGAGSLEQQTQQALDQALYGQFVNQQAFPYQQLSWLSGIDTGVGSQMGGTSSTTGPPPNPWAQIGGLGLAGVSALGGSGAFGSSGWLAGLLPAAAVKDGGRINGYDDGGGVSGVPYNGVGGPYGGAHGWVPSMQITHGKGAPAPPGVPAQQDPMKMAHDIGGMHFPNQSSSNTFGGYNYGNSDTAAAAKAGVEGGLQFDPMTGDVMARGGRVRGYDSGGTVGDPMALGQQVGAMARAIANGMSGTPPAPSGVTPQNPIYYRGGGVAPKRFADGGSDDPDYDSSPVQGFGDNLPPPPTQSSFTPASSVWNTIRGALALKEVPDFRGTAQGFGDDQPNHSKYQEVPQSLVDMLNVPMSSPESSSGSSGVSPSWASSVGAGGLQSNPTSSSFGPTPAAAALNQTAGIPGGWADETPKPAPPILEARNVAPPPGGVVPTDDTAFLRDRASGRAVNRADALNQTFAGRLSAAIRDAEEATGHTAKVKDYGRTREEQTAAYNRYISGQGGLAAPPGHSRHEANAAADIAPGPVLDWLHKNAGKYGLEFLPGHAGVIDPVHIQMAGGTHPDDGGATNPSFGGGLGSRLGFTGDSIPPRASDVAPQVAAQSGIDLSGNSKLWPALASAGFGMMASRSPFAGVAIGEGGLQGMQTYTRASELEQNRELKKSEIDLHAKKLEQEANQFQQRLAQSTAQHAETASIARERLAQEMWAPFTTEEGRTGFYNKKTGEIKTSTQSLPITAPQEITKASLEEKGIIGVNKDFANTGFDYTRSGPYIEKGMDVPEPLDTHTGKSSRSIKDDAELYLQTGKLPPVARGQSPVAMQQNNYRNAVQNYGGALAQSRGLTPQEVAEGWRTAPGMLRFVLGADGRSTVSLGTAVRHLDTLQQLATEWEKAASTGNVVVLNQIKAAIARQFGDSAVTNLQSAGQIVGPEIIKAIGVAGAGTAPEREKAQAQFSAAVSPQQMLGAIQTTQKLLAGQLEGRKNQAMNAGVSEERFKSLVGERPYELLKNIDKGAPSGPNTSSIPTVANKSEYDRLPSGAQFRDNTGKLWTKP